MAKPGPAARRPASTPAARIPPTSRRDQPLFATRSRRDELARAFQTQGEDYDRLRPGYPEPVVQEILSAGSRTVSAAPRVIDLGAGTGKLSRALAARGAHVTAVDPSRTMLEVIAQSPTGATPADVSGPRADVSGPRFTASSGAITVHEAVAEHTGLPSASADMVTAAQAWHWFDADVASREAFRLLRPGGILALVWNTLDVQIPWVHRLSRIMHAGDVHKDNFTPPVDAECFTLAQGIEHRWEDPRPTQDIINLAYTRSYVATASPERRERVLTNLDWYLHEHLGHAPGSMVGLPYRTDLFLYRANS